MKSLTVKDLICRYLSSFCGAWISRSHRAQKGVMSDYSLVKVSMCSHFWSPLLCTFIREQDCCEPRFISRDVCEQIILAIATSYASENNCMCMGPTTINTNYPPSPCFKPHIHTIMVTVYWLTLIIFAITLFAVYSASILILPIRKHVIFTTTNLWCNADIALMHTVSIFSSRQHFFVLCMQKTIV